MFGSLSKKYYEEIAFIVHDASIDSMKKSTLMKLVVSLGRMFKRDNPRFSPGAFAYACGLRDEDLVDAVGMIIRKP